MSETLLQLREVIHACELCPRLVEYREFSRRTQPAYWSRPVSGFGDPEARLLILGLAPAFHGGNQHGRIFTGDESSRWLWGALHELRACSHPNSTSRDQPLEAYGVFISNAVRCAPPQNRPTAGEFDQCRPYLARELDLLPNVHTVLALGKLAHDSYLKQQNVRLSAYPFHHGAVHRLPEGPTLLDSYHPSRQNTNTGVLTWEMWLSVLRLGLELAGSSQPGE